MQYPLWILMVYLRRRWTKNLIKGQILYIQFISSVCYYETKNCEKPINSVYSDSLE